MPLLLTPAQPLRTTSGLPVTQVYAIIDWYSFARKLRQVEFTLGYYVNEAASLPGSAVAELPINLTRGFVIAMTPDQANSAGTDPTATLEAYAQYRLAELLPGARFETVP